MNREKRFIRYSGWAVFILVLSLMTAFICGTGKFNAECLGGVGRIYDFSEAELKENNTSWEYHQEMEAYLLLKNKSVHKFNITNKMCAWECLCLNIDQMSVPTMDGSILYYDKHNEILFEQPVQFTEGDNTIFLDKNIEMYRIGIKIIGQKEQYISIAKMQIRGKAEGVDKSAMLEGFGKSIVIYTVLLGFVSFTLNKAKVKVKTNIFAKVTEILQSVYQYFGNEIWTKRQKFLEKIDIVTIRRCLFCFFFLTIMLGNILQVASNGEIYRYYLLGTALAIICMGTLMVEKPLELVSWNTPIAKWWFILWALVAVSDIVVKESNKFLGYVMLFAAGYFIFCWNQMRQPKQILREVMQALEIDFFLVVLVCMLFRRTRWTAYYNGIFLNPEEFSVYALLMLVIFLTELLHNLQRLEDERLDIVTTSGTMISFYFVLRSSGLIGFIAAGGILVVFLLHFLKMFRENGRKLLEQVKISAGMIALVAWAGICLTIMVHTGIKYLPEALGTSIELEDESVISRCTSEEIAQYRVFFQEELEGMISWDELKIPVYRKNYFRMLGITGNRAKREVYRAPVKAYCAYLETMYHYGIFTLVPFVLVQISAFVEAVKQKEVSMLYLGMNIVFLCFCLCGNVGIYIEQALFWFFFLGNGYFFMKRE